MPAPHRSHADQEGPAFHLQARQGLPGVQDPPPPVPDHPEPPAGILQGFQGRQGLPGKDLP